MPAKGQNVRPWQHDNRLILLGVTGANWPKEHQSRLPSKKDEKSLPQVARGRSAKIRAAACKFMDCTSRDIIAPVFRKMPQRVKPLALILVTDSRSRRG